ncbi:hypothetical protein PIIN_04879 [Serendipita indica DSM 11827]|uniref:F-box domain-containing protein n=1 Tax=Serendipita indica (strain DSM 11827) TaxID=1109443 RepID=G4THZ3_SERID|nr:hypothetical protein PIIN_04879 [Serendipita indica DSM 11827]
MSRELPLDLYRQIVEEIREKADLLSLCLTSRALYLEASQALYAKVRLDDLEQISAIVWTFESTPRALELTLELNIRVRMHIAQFPQLAMQMIRAINRMGNLTPLELPELWIPDPFDVSKRAASFWLVQACKLNLP